MGLPYSKSETSDSTGSKSTTSDSSNVPPQSPAIPVKELTNKPELTEDKPALTDKPWRDGLKSFSTQYDAELREQMENQFKEITVNSKTIKRANLLLLGPINNGKSSFLNSVATICKGRVANVALSGEAKSSLTTKYGKYAPKTGIMKNFCLLDCMGLEVSEKGGFNVSDACALVNGNVPRDYKFNPTSHITPEDPQYIHEPKEKNKVHCVVYVVDAEALNGDLPAELKKKIKDLQKRLTDLGTNRVMVLTKVDKLCKTVDEDIENVYKSTKVKDMVSKASELFELSLNNIFPVKNYSNETEMNVKLNIPILLALKTMLNFAYDYIEQKEDVSSDED